MIGTDNVSIFKDVIAVLISLCVNSQFVYHTNCHTETLNATLYIGLLVLCRCCSKYIICKVAQTVLGYHQDIYLIALQLSAVIAILKQFNLISKNNRKYLKFPIQVQILHIT